MASSKDVAKHAGVSQTTVSRVLNTPNLVKKPTVDKVMAAIEELNYIPNAHARSLVQNKTYTIALLSGPLHNPFFVDSTAAIVNYANSKGYRVHVQFVNDEKLNEAYTSAVENKVDGVVMSCILLDDPIFDKFEKMAIPFITYNRKHLNNEHFVEIDNFQAGALSAQHILDLDHTHIAWIGGPSTVSTFKNRYDGFVHSMSGHTLPPEYVIQTDTTKQGVKTAFEKLMRLPTPPTAICAATDAIALQTIDEATKAGFHVPSDISVVGIDNVDISKHGRIELTTVGSVSEQNLGYLAISELIEMIENKKNSCVKITESVKVFIRKTTKAYQ